MRASLLLCLLLAGCRQEPSAWRPLLCECFANAAYEAVRASRPKPDDTNTCCGKCNNTGKVRSGDGLAIVSCPCSEACPCKRKGAR